ncbi:uncharacterized protein F4822DRAFT_426615 [Hypoxylon trugodes]|uniref:uncharacterized protein n=1 Tax=Hypoxylon trugodes TaxID=326681 RepID=UPI0021959189|nr:uncharacterized protein F4822DRAFT_426615 [Hypoxylon trugodes]KAI1390770.1 hypothetical protein F4822DRAFT_426615 [Hypoxylon trugodes]
MSDTVTIDYTQITILLVVSTVLTCISTIVVTGRSWIRFGMIKKGGWDDYMSIGALICIIGYLACLYLGKTNGMGSPMSTLSIVEMETLLQITFAIEIVYYSVLTCIKMSIVFMYARFAVSTTFKKLCMATNTLLVVFFIVCIGVVVGQCRPLEKAWDVTRLVEGSCIDTTAFFYFTSIFGILLDVWIIVLPIPTLKHLQISTRSRHVLYGVFGVGALATAFSCARLYSIHTYTLAADPFRDSILVNVWSMVEINVAIWCACAPALKPIFSPQRFLDSGKTSSRNYHSLNHPGISKKGIDGSTSQSHIIPLSSGNHSTSPRGSSQGPEDIELERPRQVHV